MGKLIIFEGLDGSGKGTQTDLLCQFLLGPSLLFSQHQYLF